MMGARKRTIMFAAAQSALLIAATLTILRFVESKAAYDDARSNTGKATRLANQIAALRATQPVNLDGASIDGLTNSEIVRVGTEVGLPESAIRSIRRPAATSLEAGRYQRSDVVLELNDVSMEALLRFALCLEQNRGDGKA